MKVGCWRIGCCGGLCDCTDVGALVEIKSDAALSRGRGGGACRLVDGSSVFVR